MIKNVTLSAEERLVEEARAKADREKRSLNALFREWLEQYVGRENAAESYAELMRRLDYAASGRPFAREELNER